MTNLTLHRSEFSEYDRRTLSHAQSKNFSTSSLGSNLLSQLGTAPMTDDGVNACEAETNLKSPEVRGYLQKYCADEELRICETSGEEQ